MFIEILISVYFIIGLMFILKYKSKEYGFIDKLGDYLFVGVFWFPAWIISFCIDKIINKIV